MKKRFYRKRRLLSLAMVCLITMPSLTSQAQQFLTTIDSRNAYVHLPDDYHQNPDTYYPTIVFFPGKGENFSPASPVTHGPGAYINNGWNGNVVVDNKIVKFIVISIQPEGHYTRPTSVNRWLDSITYRFRVHPEKLHLTGMSNGGWVANVYVTSDLLDGPHTRASRIATMVEVQGEVPGGTELTAPYPSRFANFAGSGGRLLGFEQAYDVRDIQRRVNVMNTTVANSGIYIKTSFGDGGHCCWNFFYGGNSTQPTKFMLDGIEQNIYEWMARDYYIENPDEDTPNEAPVVNAGQDRLVVSPINELELPGTATDPDGTVTSYRWSQVEGNNAVLNGTTSPALILSLLQEGAYAFRLTVTDNEGATAFDDVTITLTKPVVASQEWRFNFSGTPAASAGYANVVGSPHVATPSTTFNGVTVSLIGGSTKWGHFYNSSARDGDEKTADSVGFLHPAETVTRNYVFATNKFLTPNVATDSLMISGLDPSKYYSLRFFASVDDVNSFKATPANCTTIFNVGSRTVTLNPVANTRQDAVIEKVMPNARGEIWAGVHPLGPKDPKAFKFGFLNELTIVEESLATAPSTTVNAVTISIYPNPVSGSLSVDGVSNVEYRIIDLTGYQQLSGVLHDSLAINVSALAAGLYILHLPELNYRIQFRKL
jgi:hypothetical protein